MEKQFPLKNVSNTQGISSKCPAISGKNEKRRCFCVFSSNDLTRKTASPYTRVYSCAPAVHGSVFSASPHVPVRRPCCIQAALIHRFPALHLQPDPCQRSGIAGLQLGQRCCASE